MEEEKYIKLRQEIEKYNHFYYNEDKPIISDIEYDNLLKELKKMEEENPKLLENFENKKNIDEISPTNKIGGVASEKFSKVIHKVPMLSLSNTYNIGEIKDFDFNYGCTLVTLVVS